MHLTLRTTSSFAVGRIWAAVLSLGFALGTTLCAADTGPQPADAKVKKDFYTPKDRLAAMHAAALFTPKAVADADIMVGPAQDKKQFQLHFNDKVICDFVTPGSKMGGNTPKF